MFGEGLEAASSVQLGGAAEAQKKPGIGVGEDLVDDVWVS
jgi:hypothetical protein